MQILIGSNLFKDIPSILNVDGKNQIYLEIGERDQQLLLTIDIYNSNGDHVAKLRRNAWVFRKEDIYEITTNPKSLKLIDRENNETILEIKVTNRNSIEITKGRFYTPNGSLIEIARDYLKINGVRLSGNVFIGFGKAIKIDTNSLSLGVLE